jgi:hypothetical protein
MKSSQAKLDRTYLMILEGTCSLRYLEVIDSEKGNYEIKAYKDFISVPPTYYILRDDNRKRSRAIYMVCREA